MIKSNLMRAARALAGWEQSDLAEASGISIATVRKIEQGAIGTQPRTEASIIAAFERAGLQLIPEGPDGGAGVRWKEPEMNEQMRAYVNLKTKIKGYFVYNLGQEDNEDLDCKIDELAFRCMKPSNATDLNEVCVWGGIKLPPRLVVDLEKLGEMENAIGAEQWMEEEAQEAMKKRNER